MIHQFDCPCAVETLCPACGGCRCRGNHCTCDQRPPAPLAAPMTPDRISVHTYDDYPCICVDCEVCP